MFGHDGSPHDPAYLVPFALDRGRAPLFTLHNRGEERLRGIALSLLGSGRLLWGLPTVLLPGESMIFAVHRDEHGGDPALAGTLLVRWARPSGEEYLWRATL